MDYPIVGYALIGIGGVLMGNVNFSNTPKTWVFVGLGALCQFVGVLLAEAGRND